MNGGLVCYNENKSGSAKNWDSEHMVAILPYNDVCVDTQLPKLWWSLWSVIKDW